MTSRYRADEKFVQLLNPASVTTTQTSSSLDTKGFDSAKFLFGIGAVADLAASPQGDGSWTVKIQESDDDSVFTDITDSERIQISGAKSPVVAPNASTGVFLTLNAPTHQNNVYHVGVISSKRYLRAVLTAVSTPGASLIGVFGILGDAALKPVTN